MIEKPWRDKQSWAAQGYDRDWKWKLEKEIYKLSSNFEVENGRSPKLMRQVKISH